MATQAPVIARRRSQRGNPEHSVIASLRSRRGIATTYFAVYNNQGLPDDYTMSTTKFLLLLFLSSMFHMASFMGLAFATVGEEPKNLDSFGTRFLAAYNSFGNFLLNAHILVAPVYGVLIFGIFFWYSRPLGGQLVKWTFAFPAITFITIFVFFLVMSKYDK